MRCIAIINQKGGVGKTTTTANLGVALAQRGQRVLLLDLDPQAHLTVHLGVDSNDAVPGTYELLTGGADLPAAIRGLGCGPALVSSSIDLAGAEIELANTIGREVILRDLLRAANPAFDWFLIDCPPSLGVLTVNALCAASEVLIPIQPHFLALEGVSKLLETVALVGRRINAGLLVSGLVMCMWEHGTRLAAEVVEDLQRYLAAARGLDVPWREARLFATRIRRNIKLAECPSHGQTIFEYAPRSHGALDYLALADEVLRAARPGDPEAAEAQTPIDGADGRPARSSADEPAGSRAAASADEPLAAVAGRAGDP